MGFGTTEIIVIIAVLVLFFGASKIPELARGVGEGINEFRKASEKELNSNSSENKTQSDSDEQQTESEETKKQNNN